MLECEQWKYTFDAQARRLISMHEDAKHTAYHPKERVQLSLYAVR
jgi:hypothetical protein